MRSRFLGLVLLASTAIANCSTFKVPQISYDDPLPPEPAVFEAEPPKQVEVVEIPKLLPLPGQLKRQPDGISAPEPHDPKQRVELANAAARVQPTRSGYINSVQVYPFAEGALYQVYSAPEQVTDIALQEGEQLVGSGPVAAGDTVRWIIADTESGVAATKRVHILIKPTRPDVTTNLVINTDRRTYHLELRSTDKTYMASVSWTYPQDQLIALRGRDAPVEEATHIERGSDISNLQFRYAVEGDNPPWRPLHAFDDGKKVYVVFPRGISQGEMPPLFIIGPEGKTSELVNYRVRGNYMIVDRLFAAAELRLGDGNSERRVRIVRTDGRRW
jgi:type IV secretion system protein TrbG